MKKSKRIFIIIFSVLLIILTTGVLSFYDNAKEKVSNNNGALYGYLDEQLPLLTMSLSQEINPDYQLLSFSEEVPQGVRNKITKDVNSYLESVKYSLEEDGDFAYSMKDTKTGEALSNNMEAMGDLEDKSKFKLYTTITSREDNELAVQGGLYRDRYSEDEVRSMILNNIGYDYYDDEDGELPGYDRDSITLNMPKDIEVTYIVPDKLTYDGMISYYNYQANYFEEFPIIALIICSSIIGIFILFYPIAVVEEVNPFLLIKKWKGEINIALLATAIFFAVFGVIILCGYTISGYLVHILTKFYVGINPIFISIINFVAWILTLLLISLAVFLIKYIFARGFIRYLKEDTLVGSFFRYTKKKVNEITEIDLSHNINKQIIKYVLINTLIIAFMVAFWGFGYIFLILYAFGSFFWIKKKAEIIQRDYNKLLEGTKELGRGNFNNEINEDMGAFNGLRDEFKNIKTSFEKAVREETKSQNMKTELISNVSHDLKTPLTCIKNYIVLLQDDNITEEARHEYLDSLNQYSNRLTNLIEDLFEVSKVNSGDISLELMELNIVALIEQTQAECSDALSANGLSIINSFENSDVTLNLDGGKTYRIFENLFTNIGKYSMANSRVYISVRETEDDVIIEFKNISKTQMNFTPEEIVERFFRGDKSRHESGSGLGLAIVKSFTEVQGGKFDINIDGDLFKTIITFKKSKNQVL